MDHEDQIDHPEPRNITRRIEHPHPRHPVPPFVRGFTPDGNSPGYYISDTYRTVRYGGAEEGGWWYNHDAIGIVLGPYHDPEKLAFLLAGAKVVFETDNTDPNADDDNGRPPHSVLYDGTRYVAVWDQYPPEPRRPRYE